MDLDELELTHRLRVCQETPTSDPEGLPIEISEEQLGSLQVTVVRDDLLCGGTKSRFLKSYLEEAGLVEKYREFLYFSPWYGGAQLALAWTCSLLPEHKAVIVLKAPEGLEGVVLDRDQDEEIDFDDPRLPPYTKVALYYGAKVIFSTGLPEMEIEEYLLKNPKAYYLPSGFRTPQMVAAIADIAKNLKRSLGRFDECWCAVGSGSLILALQQANLSERYYGVCVHERCPPMGEAIPIIPEVPFEETLPEATFPPFPSTFRYDAKAWAYLQAHAQGVVSPKRVLFWNVM
jgi:hypothetical protein